MAESLWSQSLIKDQYPVTEGHTLIVPKIHRETYFDLVKEEVEELIQCFIPYNGWLQGVRFWISRPDEQESDKKN